MQINAGSVAEQYVAQELLACADPYSDKKLHFWAREARGSSAEVDFLIEIDGKPIPVEVKAGARGSLKSVCYLQSLWQDNERLIQLNQQRPSIFHLCEKAYIELRLNYCWDHIHLHVLCPPELAPSKIVQYVKGRSSRMIQQEFLHLLRLFYPGYLNLDISKIIGITVFQIVGE